MGDGEKYDKIRSSERKTLRRLTIGLFVLVGCFTVVVHRQHDMKVEKERLAAERERQALEIEQRAVEREHEQQQQLAMLRGAASDEEKRKEEEPVREEPVVEAAAAEAVVVQGEGVAAAAAQEDQVVIEEEAPKEDLATLRAKRLELDRQVRAHKNALPDGEFMETQPQALALTGKLQDATRAVLKARYGDHQYYVRVTMEETPCEFVVEMADVSKVPVSVFQFMEIARTFKGGKFHRNAPHVQQFGTRSGAPESLSFQEYHESLPHSVRSTGYAGRPSSTDWYVSIEDNTFNHGPGTQQKENPNEADARFGKVVEGYDECVLRMHREAKSEDFMPAEDHVHIKSMTILVGDENGEKHEWTPVEETVGE